MRFPEARPEDPPATGEGRLAAQLDAASNLALFGATKLGRDVCASIFLHHLPLFTSDRDSKRRFVECLLLLGMTNLLTRLLRALDGVDLDVVKLVADGAEHMILSFSTGRSLNIPLHEIGPHAAARSQSAAAWSTKILEAAECAAAPALPPLATKPNQEKPQSIKYRQKYERLAVT